MADISNLLRKDYGTESMVLRLSTLTETGVAIRSTAIYKNHPFQNSSFSAGSDVGFGSPLTVKMGLSKLIAPSTTLKASLEIPGFSPKISTKCRFLRQLLPSLTAKASLELPDYKSCSISLRFLREYTALSMRIYGNGVIFQAGLGSRSFAVGVQKILQTDSARFGIGVQGTLPHGDTASLLYSSKGNKIRARILLPLDEKRKKYVVLDIRKSFSSGETKFTVAGSWAIDDQVFMNARLDHHGTLKTLLKRDIGKHNSAVSISAEFDVKNGRETPKFGFAVVI